MIPILATAAVAVSALVAIVLSPYLSRWKSRRALLKLPGPPFRNFFLGNLEGLPPRQERLQYMLKLTGQYGSRGAMRMFFGPLLGLQLTGLAHIREILTTNKAASKSSFYDNLRPWLGDGLLISSGEKWKVMRRLTTPAFHFEVLQRFLVVMNEESDILVERIRAQEGKVIDAFEYVTACALDIICETAMGQKVGAQTVEGHTPYVDAVYEMSRLLVSKFEKPWLTNDFIFSLTSGGKRYFKALKVLHNFTNRVIKERKELLAKDDATLREKPAFLDTLLRAQQAGESITEENIREEVDTFMFEGHDTTSASMAWTIQLLGLHPEIQETLYQEISEVMGNEKDVTQEMISQFRYLDMVIKESLRIYPSVAGIGRVLTEDYEVDGVTIPKGTNVNISIYTLHHNPLYWNEPEKFDPERWTPENSEGRDPYQYIPFSAGSRNCIGQKFASNEEKVILAKIVKNFRIVSLDKNPAMVAELILRPVNGVKATFHART